MASERPHGTAKRYDHGPDENDQPGKGCRCKPCTKDKVAKGKRQRLEKLQGRRKMVGAGPARRHVQGLLALPGVDPATVARAAKVTDHVMHYLLHGEAAKGLPPAVTIRRTNAAKLLAVRPEDLKPRRVPVVASQRRLRGLAVAGWSMPAVGDFMGVPPRTLLSITRAEPTAVIEARTADLITSACRALWTRDPVKEGVSPRVAGIVRTMAAAKRWLPLLAWDDIDDPDAVPNVGEEPAHLGAIVDHAEKLTAKGFTAAQAAEQLGVRPHYLYYARGEVRRASEAVDA